jgi:hypothetical protein
VKHSEGGAATLISTTPVPLFNRISAQHSGGGHSSVCIINRAGGTLVNSKLIVISVGAVDMQSA